MEYLRNGRFTHQMATPEEIKAAVKELKAKVKKYHWEDQKVAPYGFYITVEKFLNGYDDIEKFSSSSRSLAISEINGFIQHCVTPWEKTELEPKMTVKLQNGKIKEVAESTAKDLIELGIATAI